MSNAPSTLMTVSVAALWRSIVITDLRGHSGPARRRRDLAREGTL
jgi:hypothetical protein